VTLLWVIVGGGFGEELILARPHNRLYRDPLQVKQPL
jgi:hypothetical protein